MSPLNNDDLSEMVGLSGAFPLLVSALSGIKASGVLSPSQEEFLETILDEAVKERAEFVNATDYLSDVQGLYLIALALQFPQRKKDDPGVPNVQFNSIWRDGGRRQNRIGRQLEKLAKALEGT